MQKKKLSEIVNIVKKNCLFDYYPCTLGVANIEARMLLLRTKADLFQIHSETSDRAICAASANKRLAT